MKDMDLMNAMNDLSDDILRDAETFPIRRRGLLPRIAAVAAALAMVCVTAYALHAGVALNWGTQPDTIYVEDWGEYREYMPYEVSYVLEAVDIPDESYDILQDTLDRHWAWCSEHSIWSGISGRFLADDHAPVAPEEDIEDYPEGLSFDSLAQAEEFLGLALELPQVLRDAAQGQVQAEILTESLHAWDEANQVPDSVSPGALVLHFGADAPTEALERVNVTVLLALTPEGAADPLALSWGSWQEYLGQPQLESRVYPQLFGEDVEADLLYYQPNGNHTGQVTAMYVTQGIGYNLEAIAAPTAQTEDARDLIVPLLDEVLNH